VPVHHHHRSYGKSQFFNFPRVARTLMDLTRLWWDLVVHRDHLKDGPAPGGAHAGPDCGQRRANDVAE
jgi:hypothetical protein